MLKPAAMTMTNHAVCASRSPDIRMKLVGTSPVITEMGGLGVADFADTIINPITIGKVGQTGKLDPFVTGFAETIYP